MPEPINAPKLLVVEDDARLRDALCQTLVFRGFSVDAAANGNEALALLKKTSYQALILDLVFRNKYKYINEVCVKHLLLQQAVSPRMPITFDRNGVVLRKRYLSGVYLLKKMHQEAPDLPVFVISGYADDAMVIEASITGGAYNFFLKPFEEEDLVRAVSNALQFSSEPEFIAHTGEYDQLRIEGVLSESHIFLRQYGAYFEQYLWNFKGLRAKPVFFPEYDTLVVKFETPEPFQEVERHFREYLRYAEQFEPVNPIVSAPRSVEQAQHYCEELLLQIQHFAANLKNAYWINREPVAPAAPQANTVLVNPYKVINAFSIKFEAQKRHSAGINVSNLECQATELITSDRTAEAFKLLIEFCASQGQDYAKALRELYFLKYKINRALNDKNRHIIDLPAYYQELNNAHNALLFEIIPSIVHLAQRGGFSGRQIA